MGHVEQSVLHYLWCYTVVCISYLNCSAVLVVCFFVIFPNMGTFGQAWQDTLENISTAVWVQYSLVPRRQSHWFPSHLAVQVALAVPLVWSLPRIILRNLGGHWRLMEHKVCTFFHLWPGWRRHKNSNLWQPSHQEQLWLVLSAYRLQCWNIVDETFPKCYVHSMLVGARRTILSCFTGTCSNCSIN